MENKIELQDFEPRIFGHFVEFIYRGRYTDHDDVTDHNRFHDSAAAWTLGEYLGAQSSLDFAMKTLYEIYFSPNGTAATSGFGPKTIEYCYTKIAPGSRLRHFYMVVTLTYWSKSEIIHYEPADKGE